MQKRITLTITNSCNLNCIYCYEKYKTNDNMNKEIAKNIIIAEFDKLKDDNTILIDFMGGEPFINFELIKYIVEYFKDTKYSSRIKYFVSTNGTLVKGEIKQWLILNREIISCGLSLDGSRTSHNYNRSNSFDNIDIEFFKSNWNNSVKMTISPYSLNSLADDVIFLHSKGFEVMNNFAYGVDWTGEKLKAILKSQLEKLIPFYLENLNVKPCQLLNLKIGEIAYRHQKKKQASCGAGVSMAVYDVFGERYPCHFFEPLSIGEEKSKLSELIKFEDVSNLIDDKCKDCVIYSICKTCYGSNYSATGDPRKRDINLCYFTKISSYYTAILLLNKIKKYGIENLNLDLAEQKAVCIAIEDIYKYLSI